jgi:hypothetical protein
LPELAGWRLVKLAKLECNPSTLYENNSCAFEAENMISLEHYPLNDAVLFCAIQYKSDLDWERAHFRYLDPASMNGSNFPKVKIVKF